jgi:hypothetical protein
MRVFDTTGNGSVAFAKRTLENVKRGNLSISYRLIPDPVDDQVHFTTIRSTTGALMCSALLKPDGVWMRSWNYATYLNDKFYLSENTYLSGNRSTPLPMWLNTDTYLGETPFSDTLALATTMGTFDIRLDISNPHTHKAECFLSVDKLNGRYGYASLPLLNWQLQNVGSIEIGCTGSGQTPYDMEFEDILIEGDVPDPDWFYIREYQGFKVDPADEDILWVGARKISDVTTHSEPTELKNLARYNYAKPSTPTTFTSSPKGILWYRQ